MRSLSSPAIAAFATSGLNIVGVASGEPYQNILPGCRAVIVIASGGKSLWSSFTREIERHPDYFIGCTDPLDDFVERMQRRVDPDPGPDRRWVRCAATESVFVDFRILGQAAGIGWHSRLGLLLHPEFGPWLGLRLACFTTEPLPSTGPPAGTGPCANCPAPCVVACPAAAVDPRMDWNPTRCSSFHENSTQCRTTCHARAACPEGASHRYTEVQFHYHSDRLSGRRLLAASLGLPEDDLGAGPHWRDYAESSLLTGRS